MKEHTIQTIDPAEICECNPEWSSVSGSSDWDDCRCSIIDPSETKNIENNKKS